MGSGKWEASQSDTGSSKSGLTGSPQQPDMRHLIWGMKQ